MAFVGAYFWLLLVYFLLQVASNTAQAPYQGLGPEAIPEKDYGRFGAFYGMGNLLGTLIGFVVTGIFTSQGRYDLALYAMAAMLVVSMALTVTLVPDRGTPDASLRRGLGAITLGTLPGVSRTITANANHHVADPRNTPSTRAAAEGASCPPNPRPTKAAANDRIVAGLASVSPAVDA